MLDMLSRNSVHVPFEVNPAKSEQEIPGIEALMSLAAHIIVLSHPDSCPGIQVHWQITCRT